MLKQELQEWQDVKKALGPLLGMASDVKHIEGHCQVIVTMLDMLVDEDLSSKLETLEKRLQAQRDDAVQKEREELLDWLSKDDFLRKHRHVLGTRQKGTATWVTEAPKFQDWLSDSKSRTLWCHGILGCGKTVMFSTMVDYLRARTSINGSLVAAIYFDYKETNLHDVRTVLAGLLRQLLETAPDSPKLKQALLDLKKTCVTRGHPNASMSDMIGLLHQIHDLGFSFTLCFDALDEIPNASRVSLLKWLSQAASQCDFKTLLMSRSHIEIKPRSENFVECEVIATDSDLEVFLNAKIDDTDSECLFTAVPRSNALRKEIIATIVSRSRGMFLLADLQFAHLEGAISEREIKDLLQVMPEEINEQYRSYFVRIRAQRQGHLALRAISWIHFARRPLTAVELLEALSVRKEDERLERTGMTTMERILSITGGLIIYEKESKHVRLVHETLQEYLREWRSTILPDTHLSISEVLQTYLNFKKFNFLLGDSQTATWANISALSRDHKLLNYAFLNWGYHINRAGPCAIPIGIEIASRSQFFCVDRAYHVDRTSSSFTDHWSRFSSFARGYSIAMSIRRSEHIQTVI